MICSASYDHLFLISGFTHYYNSFKTYLYGERVELLPYILLNPWSYSLYQLEEHLWLNTEEILEVGMVLSEELIHQLFIVTVYWSPRKPWSHPPPPPPPCCSFFTLATSSSLFFLLQYYNDGHTTHDVKMGELSFELTSSQHRDYCRNDRWKQGDRLLYLHPYLGEGV